MIKNNDMIKTITNSGHVRLTASEGHVLHRKGDNNYPLIRDTTVTADKADEWEELTDEQWGADRLSAYKSGQYSTLLSAMVHERYSLDDEIALAANVNSPVALSDDDKAQEIADEYMAYQRYRAECKAKARAEVDKITFVPDMG